MWRDASRIRRSVTEAISFSYPHGTTSGWLLAALGAEHGLRQHLVCLCRSTTRCVPGSLEIIEKTPGAPGPAAVTEE